MIKKEYEKPIVETIEFELQESIMNGDLGLSGTGGADDGSGWELCFVKSVTYSHNHAA